MPKIYWNNKLLHPLRTTKYHQYTIYGSSESDNVFLGA